MHSRFASSHVLVCAAGLSGVLALAAPGAHAATGLASIRLTAERDILRADGQSSTIISAEVRDDRGAVVPDGTLVRFSTTAGRLDATTAATQSGVARVVLFSANLPGTALVSANIEGGFTAAPAQRTIAFATDADIAEAGANWARIEGDYVGYAVDFQIIQANKKSRPARVAYRGAVITANALQVSIHDNTVRAVGAVTLARGRETRKYNNLRYNLTTAEGLAEGDKDGIPVPVQVRGPGLEEAPATEKVSNETFALEDISAASMVVVARSIGLEPNVQLQFRRAAFYLDGTRVLSVPLHVMAIGQETLFAEQVLGYGAAGITVDVPLYYDVRPSAVGTLHVRHGARVGASVYSARPGWSLDLEHAYNRGGGTGGASDGTIQVTGVTRQDWGARWSHSQRFDARSQGRLYVDFPNHNDLFVNTLLSRSFRGFSLNATAAASRSAVHNAFSGSRSPGGDWRGQLYADTTPRPLAGLPRVQYSFQLGTARQGFYGPGAIPGYDTRTAGVRLWSTPITLTRGTTLSQSLSLGQTWASGGGASAGRNGASTARNGASILGTLALARRLGSLGDTTLTYDYTQTPEHSLARASGQHRLGANLFLGSGERWNLALTSSRALDEDTSTLYSSLQFALGGPWRGRISLFTSHLSGFRYQDVECALIRRVGGRDITLYYSTTSRRFQLDLSGARF